MRSFLLILATALAVVGVFILVSRTGRDRDSTLFDGLGRPLDAAGAANAPGIIRAGAPEPMAAPPRGPVLVNEPTGIEGLHHRHGRVGEAMRGIIELTVGSDWNAVDRNKMQELLHTLKYTWTADDVPYMLELFGQIKDPAFRWWFAWIARQVPDERFVDALTEVYQLDPVQALDALAAIGKPKTIERINGLLEAQPNADIRRHALVAISRTDWDGRDGYFSGIAADVKRPTIDRVQSLIALGQIGRTAETLDLLMNVASGPAQPMKDLGALAVEHPSNDLRSPAVLAVMLRGDLDAVRRLIDLADQPNADPVFAGLVDRHIGAFMGPDLQEIIYARSARRGFVTPGEVVQLVRDANNLDKPRLATLRPLARDPEAAAILDRALR